MKKAVLILTDHNGNTYISITLATGSANTWEATLMMMYDGIGFSYPFGKDKPYVLLENAITWNREEAKYCKGDKSHFHLRLAEELSDMPKKEDWEMSDELLLLFSKSYPEQTKMLYRKFRSKSGEKGLSDRAKKIIESSFNSSR